MVHTEAGHTEARRNGSAKGRANHQRTDQARPCRIGHRVNIQPFYTRVRQHLIDEWQVLRTWSRLASSGTTPPYSA